MRAQILACLLVCTSTPCFASMRMTAIYGEIVLHILLQAHAEEATVLKTSLLLTRACALKCYIMRIAVEGRFYVAEGYISECIPSHQTLWKFEGTVLYHP